MGARGKGTTPSWLVPIAASYLLLPMHLEQYIVPVLDIFLCIAMLISTTGLFHNVWFSPLGSITCQPKTHSSPPLLNPLKQKLIMNKKPRSWRREFVCNAELWRVTRMPVFFCAGEQQWSCGRRAGRSDCAGCAGPTAAAAAAAAAAQRVAGY